MKTTFHHFSLKKEKRKHVNNRKQILKAEVVLRKKPRTTNPQILYNVFSFQFLRATAVTAVARLRHRNSVCLSVCVFVTRVDQSKTVQARIAKFSPSAV